MGLEAVFSRGTSSVRKNGYLHVSFPGTSSTLGLDFKPLTGTQGHVYGLWKNMLCEVMPCPPAIWHTPQGTVQASFPPLISSSMNSVTVQEDFPVHHDQIEFSPTNMLVMYYWSIPHLVFPARLTSSCYSIQRRQTDAQLAPTKAHLVYLALFRFIINASAQPLTLLHITQTVV